MRFAALLVLASAFGAPLRAQDVVELDDGSTLEGRVLYVDDERVVLREKRRDREIPAERVTALRTIHESLRELLTRAEGVPRSSVGANLELAQFARSRGLAGEAGVFYWRALLADPTCAPAHEGLGHKRRGDRWAMEHDKRTYTDLEKLREAAREWRHSFVLSTAHFELRTNVELEEAVSTAIDMERFYLALYDLFATELGLYECTEVMYAQVHADQKSYPEPSSGAWAYFSQGPNVLFLNASQGLQRDMLVHECTHQIFHNVTELDRSFSGDMPAWLDEGLAEYIAASTFRPPQPLAFDPGFPNLNHFARHGTAKKPLSLSRVLALQTGDFVGNSRAFEMYAQSYTLVHWGLHADDGAHREAFFQCMRDTFQGRSSPSQIKKSLDLGKDFEETWQEYARVKAEGG